MSKELYMDDVQDIALSSFKVIESNLREFGITLTPEQEDEIYVPIVEYLEKFSNGNYRSYN
jgi:hypothetical protein